MKAQVLSMVVGFCQMKGFLIKTRDKPMIGKGWFWNKAGWAGPRAPEYGSEYGNDYTDCQVCSGGPENAEVELPVMSTKFCDQCREKEKQGRNQPKGSHENKRKIIDNISGLIRGQRSKDYTDCQICWGGPLHLEVELPEMSTEFCDSCKKKEKQGSNQPVIPKHSNKIKTIDIRDIRGPGGQRSNSGSTKRSPNRSSNKGSQKDNPDCEVCWGGTLNNAMELPIMTSEFCDRCIGKQKQGNKAGPGVPEFGSEYGNDDTDCQICSGGPTHSEMELPEMNTEFCDICREKEKQGSNQPVIPQREGSPKHSNKIKTVDIRDNRGPGGQRSHDMSQDALSFTNWSNFRIPSSHNGQQ